MKKKAKSPRKPTYKPSKAELATIRKGEAAIRRGESVSLGQFLQELRQPKITKAISESAGRFKTGRYEP